MMQPAGKTPQFRNVKKLIQLADPTFEYAERRGVLHLHGKSGSGRKVHLRDGRTVLDFARGSYLGLDNHPHLIRKAQEALTSYNAIQWSGARTRLNFELMEDLEAKLGGLFGAEVQVFSLVLTANMGILPLIASGALTGDRKPLVVFDQNAHATLAYHKAVVADDTAVETIPHNDIERLEQLCHQYEQVAFVTDGVFSMGGSAPIGDLIHLQNQYGLFLYIDDAHGISIQGRNGEGYARSRLRDLGDRTVVAASLSKGFGATGGILMMGDRRIRDLLRRYSVPHAFSMGPSVPDVGAALGSAEVHETNELSDRQKRLWARVQDFDRILPTEQVGEEVPMRIVRFGDERTAIDAAAGLLDHGFNVIPVFFPTVQRGAAGLRVCLTADHTHDDVVAVCGAIESARGRALAMS